MHFKCLRGIIKGTKFTCEDGSQVNFLPYKDRNYPEGIVYAQFRVNGNTYFLDTAISC